MKNIFVISTNGEVLCKCSTEAEEAITIPEGIVAIRQDAFRDCKQVTAITLPTTLKKIGSHAFQGCSTLKRIHLPNGVEYIGKGAFKDCSNLVSAVIPPSVKELPNSTFENNYNLRYVKMPKSGLEIIGDNCFKCCLYLKKIVIPRSVLSMGTAFPSCWKLEKVIMRTENARIKKSAFNGCADNLTIDCVVTAKQFFKDFNKYNTNKAEQRIIKKKDFAGKILWPNTVRFTPLPDHIETIEEEAFRDCTGLEAIGIPQSVRDIKDRTFAGCNRLSKLTIEEGVEVIGKNAFENCSRLTNLHLPDSLKVVDEHAFTGCSSLKKVSISQHTSVAVTAFDSNNIIISYR